MKGGGPLGPYSAVVASFVAIGVIAAAIYTHITGAGDAFLDNTALLAIGAVFGANASAAITNGSLGANVNAIHARLDAAGIAPASSMPGPKGDTGSTGPQGPPGPPTE